MDRPRSYGWVLVAGFACASSLQAAESLAALQGLQPRSERAALAEASRSLRDDILREAAQAAGVQGGYRERNAEIAAHLSRTAPELDGVFNFAPLVQQGRLLVPAVEWVREVSAVELDGSQLRETASVLRIVEEARLVSVPPTWRDYLSSVSPAGRIERPADDFLPRDARERAIWATAVAEAWDVGRRQAEAVYRSELATLSAAYQGRILYLSLVNSGVVDPASLGQVEFGIVREDTELRIDDRLFNVRDAARFAEPTDWRALVRPSMPSSPVVRAREGVELNVTGDDAQ